jgi:hypothetical protein
VLGHVARARGHHDRAVGHHARAADLFGALGDVPGLAWSRYDLALLARHRGDPAGAEGHLRESLTRFRELGDARAVACASWALTAVEEVRRGRAGGAERLLLEAHRCCGADPRAATCLTAPSPVGCPRRQDASFPSGLGRAEVARLVADGSTNRQIGRALGIAEKTTEAHVHNIIRKLGAHNRAEVAARVSVPDEAD